MAFSFRFQYLSIIMFWEVIGFHWSQVWGVKEGPYEFKPAPASSCNDMFSPSNFAPSLSMPKEKRIDGSFVLQEWFLSTSYVNVQLCSCLSVCSNELDAVRHWQSNKNVCNDMPYRLVVSISSSSYVQIMLCLESGKWFMGMEIAFICSNFVP